MRMDASKSRAQIQLQLRARALLFDKASVTLFLRPPQQSSSSALISKLNPSYLQLHGDDIYFSYEDCSREELQQRDGAAASKKALPKLQSKPSISVGSRYGDKDMDNLSQRPRHDELPETWYSQFFEKYRGTKPYRITLGDQENDRRTPEQMSTYIRIHEKIKRRRATFKEDETNSIGNRVSESGSSMARNSILDENEAIDDEIAFFPETMFPLNCVPGSALPPIRQVEQNQKVDFNGVLDTLPKIMAKRPIMIERLGIRPENLNMEQGGNQFHGKSGDEGKRRYLSQEQASEMSRKVIAHMLADIGFEGLSEVPMEVLSQLLSCHTCKLGHVLKMLADSYRKQFSAFELIKMFLQTAGYSNLGGLAEIVKDTSRSPTLQPQQQLQVVQSQLHRQHQASLRQSQQVLRQLDPQMQMQMQMQIQMQQMVQPQNLPFQQQQQLERMRRRQTTTPRPGMNMTMEARPMVQVKIENPSEFPLESNTFATMNARHPQLQFQQQQIAAMSNFQAQSSNQFRPQASIQIPQVQTPNAGTVRAQPVKVEGFQELMGGDAALKHDTEGNNKLTSPK